MQEALVEPVDLLANGLQRVKEVAKFCGVSRAQVYRLMENGELPYVKLGKCRRIPQRAVLEMVNRNLFRREG
jgi:excisionase family DNA binding protein